MNNKISQQQYLIYSLWPNFTKSMFSIDFSTLQYWKNNMGLVARKSVFGVSVKARFKPVSSASETIYKIEISPVASFYIKLSKKRKTKVLIRLRGWASWSAPVLFANSRRQVFSRRGPYLWTDQTLQEFKEIWYR